MKVYVASREEIVTHGPVRRFGNPDFAVHRYAANLRIVDEWSADRKLFRSGRCAENARLRIEISALHSGKPFLRYRYKVPQI